VSFVLAAIFLPMASEASLAARNERRQFARGGVEPRGDVYRMMRVAYPGAFLAMILEGALRGGPPAWIFWSGVALFAAAKALKWWAIATLGPSWTFRVVVVPGMPIVTSGPYRFVRHPNYVAVVGELAGAALMTGAIVAGPVATAGFAALIARRIAVEERILSDILRSE
jgi:methyltransferase